MNFFFVCFVFRFLFLKISLCFIDVDVDFVLSKIKVTKSILDAGFFNSDLHLPEINSV